MSNDRYYLPLGGTYAPGAPSERGHADPAPIRRHSPTDEENQKRDAKIWQLDRAGTPHNYGPPSQPDPQARPDPEAADNERRAKLAEAEASGAPLRELLQLAGGSDWDAVMKRWDARMRAKLDAQPDDTAELKRRFPEAFRPATGPSVQEMRAQELRGHLDELYGRSRKPMRGAERARLDLEIRAAEQELFGLEARK